MRMKRQGVLAAAVSLVRCSSRFRSRHRQIGSWPCITIAVTVLGLILPGRMGSADQSTDPTGTAGTSATTLRLQALQENQGLRVIGRSWSELGPAPFFGLGPGTEFRCGDLDCGLPNETISGQVGAIAVDLAHDPTGNLVYVGSSSGGLWKSTNGLSATPHFVPLSDQSQSLSIGAIGLDTRSNPPVIFVGTGMPDNSANISSYTGVGILISADGGATWKRVDNADNGAHTFVGQGFSSILIDPVDPDTLLASTGLGIDYQFPHSSIPQGDAAFKDLGIYRSTDAGKTWTQVMSADYGPPPPQGFYHTDLLYESTRGTYFAGISKLGLFASTDRGERWRTFKELGWGLGLPDAGQMKRISLATRNGVLWALLMSPSGSGDFFRLFQSDDYGHSWSPLSLPRDLTPKGFLMYVASPPNSNTLLVAAEHLFRNDNILDSSTPWVEIEHNIHGDQHAIAFTSVNKGPQPSTADSRWYVGDDGGAWATQDRGEHWTSLNEDLRTLEFFSVDGDSAGSGSYAGGTNDNGPVFTTASPVGAHHVFPAWDQAFFGDGMYVAADPKNSAAFFMSEPHGNIFYFLVSSPSNPKTVINFGGSADFLTPYEILRTDPRLYLNTLDVFPNIGTSIHFGPSFNFARSRFILAGATNPWLIAFDPGAPSNNTVSRQIIPASDDPQMW